MSKIKNIDDFFEQKIKPLTQVEKEKLKEYKKQTRSKWDETKKKWEDHLIEKIKKNKYPNQNAMQEHFDELYDKKVSPILKQFKTDRKFQRTLTAPTVSDITKGSEFDKVHQELFNRLATKMEELGNPITFRAALDKSPAFVAKNKEKYIRLANSKSKKHMTEMVNHEGLHFLDAYVDKVTPKLLENLKDFRLNPSHKTEKQYINNLKEIFNHVQPGSWSKHYEKAFSDLRIEYDADGGKRLYKLNDKEKEEFDALPTRYDKLKYISEYTDIPSELKDDKIDSDPRGASLNIGELYTYPVTRSMYSWGLQNQPKHVKDFMKKNIDTALNALKDEDMPNVKNNLFRRKLSIDEINEKDLEDEYKKDLEDEYENDRRVFELLKSPYDVKTFKDYYHPQEQLLGKRPPITDLIQYYNSRKQLKTTDDQPNLRQQASDINQFAPAGKQLTQVNPSEQRRLNLPTAQSQLPQNRRIQNEANNVAHAGQHGDTRLSFTTPQQRNTLQNQGGIGDKNLKTGLFEEYPVNKQQHNDHSKSYVSRKFDGLRAVPISNHMQPQKQYTAGNQIASAHKSIASGVLGGAADGAALAYNLPAMGANYLAKKGLPLWGAKEYDGPDNNADQLPLIPSAVEGIDNAYDKITNGYTETPPNQKHINNAGHFMGEMLSGGLARKGGKYIGNKFLENVGAFTGSANPWHIAGAGAAGGVMSKSQDSDDGTLKTIGKGVGTQAAVNAIPAILTKGGFALSGLGKNSLKLDTAKAGKELGMDLPKAVVTNNGLTGLADQFLNKMPLSGNIMQKRYGKIGEKVLQELDNAYESVISAKDLSGIEQKISRMYDSAKNSLPNNAQTVPTNTVNAISEIRDELKAFSNSGDYKKLLSHINEIEKHIAPHGIKNIPTEVKMLVNQKENTGNLIYGDIKTPKGRFFSQHLDRAIKDDLATYGQSNSEWYKYFSGADKLYSKKETRKSLEKLLGSKAESATHGELTYGSLSKVLNTPETKDQLRELVKPEIFTRLEKLGNVTQAMASKNKSIPNPSGTAVTQAAINVLGGLTGFGVTKYGFVEPTTAVSSLIGGAAVAHLLTDKKTLDLAIKLAEKPTEKAAIAFNRRMKEITGYTPVTLAKEAAKRSEQEQDKEGNNLRSKFNAHIEKNKKRPKGQALINVLSSPAAKKGAEVLRANPWKN